MIVPEGFWEIIGQSRQRARPTDERALIHRVLQLIHYHVNID